MEPASRAIEREALMLISPVHCLPLDPIACPSFALAPTLLAPIPRLHHLVPYAV